MSCTYQTQQCMATHKRPNSAWQHTKEYGWFLNFSTVFLSQHDSIVSRRLRLFYLHSTDKFGSMTIETTFIWDHVHLRPRHLRPRSFETTTFKTTFIWDYIHSRPLHLRPQSFENCSSDETTFIWNFFIWDHIHLRPQSFETTFIWDHIHWDHIHLRSHSFHAMLKRSCFDLLCVTFLWSTLHFFAGDLKFCKATIPLKFCKVAPFRDQGCTLPWSRLNNAGMYMRQHSGPDWEGGNGGNCPWPLIPSLPVEAIICFK